MAASESHVSHLYAKPLTDERGWRKAIWSGAANGIVLFGEAWTDFFAVALCVLLAGSIQLLGSHGVRHVVTESIVIGLFASIVGQQRCTRRKPCNLAKIRVTTGAIRTAVLSQGALLCVCLLKGGMPFFGRCLMVLPAMAVSLIIARRGLAVILRSVQARGYGAKQAVIYGQKDTVRLVASALLQSPGCGLRPAAAVCDDVMPVESMFNQRDHCSRMISVKDGALTAGILETFHCDVLIVAASQLTAEQTRELTKIARKAGAATAIPWAAGQSETAFHRLDIDGMSLATNEPVIKMWHSDLMKRVGDIVIAAILLVLLTPLFLSIALCIALDSPGPVLFVQKRVGRNGELFDMWKFRSMFTTAAPYDVSPTTSSDVRITRIGRVIRRTSLDELPQLVNVLLGRMSLVGPRPEMPFLVASHLDKHRPRLQVAPGITGLWQLSADRAAPIHNNTHYDLFYIRNRTFYMDIAILIHTVLSALRGGI